MTIQEHIDSLKAEIRASDLVIEEYRQQCLENAAEISRLRAALSAPMQLRQGECWPESIMAQWDYYRKLIASGDTSSAPRDWFEGLAETRLIAAPATAPDEIQQLRAESEERLQNCAALVSENERLRSELARPESTDMTLMRTLAQSQATELEQLRKDAEHKPMTDKDIAGAIVRSPDPVAFGRLPAEGWRPMVRLVEAFHGIKGTP